MRLCICNDPFVMVMMAAEKVKPNIEALIQFDDIDQEMDGFCGITEWPDDGTTPRISISCNIPVIGAVDVLAHELAHVIAGSKEDHSEEWEKALDAINNAYMEIGTNMVV